MTMTTDTVAPPYGAALELPVQKWLPITRTYAAFDGPFPVYVYFADGDMRQVSSWRDVYGQVATWLALTGRLTDAVAFPANEDRNLVTRNAVHSDGMKFERPYLLPNGLWLEVAGEERLQRDLAIMLLRERGVEPSSVLVMLDL